MGGDDRGYGAIVRCMESCTTVEPGWIDAICTIVRYQILCVLWSKVTMSKQQIEEVREMVDGLVAGRLLEAGLDRKTITTISHNAGAYVAGQLREVVRT